MVKKTLRKNPLLFSILCITLILFASIYVVVNSPSIQAASPGDPSGSGIVGLKCSSPCTTDSSCQNSQEGYDPKDTKHICKNSFCSVDCGAGQLNPTCSCTKTPSRDPYIPKRGNPSTKNGCKQEQTQEQRDTNGNCINKVDSKNNCRGQIVLGYNDHLCYECKYDDKTKLNKFEAIDPGASENVALCKGFEPKKDEFNCYDIDGGEDTTTASFAYIPTGLIRVDSCSKKGENLMYEAVCKKVTDKHFIPQSVLLTCKEGYVCAGMEVQPGKDGKPGLQAAYCKNPNAPSQDQKANKELDIRDKDGKNSESEFKKVTDALKEYENVIVEVSGPVDKLPDGRWAPYDFCSNCKVQHPIFEEAISSSQLKGKVTVIKITIESFKADFYQSYIGLKFQGENGLGLPAIIYYKNEKEVARSEGISSKETIISTACSVFQLKC